MDKFVSVPKLSRMLVGSVPSVTVRKYGGTPPDQERKVGSQWSGGAGVLITRFPWPRATAKKDAKTRRDVDLI